MVTNATKQDDKKSEAVANDDQKVTDEDLRDLKYGKDGVESADKAEDEPNEPESNAEGESEEAGEEDGQTDDQTKEEESEETDETESAEDASEFVKKFPNLKGESLEEYVKTLESSYENSSTEAIKLKRQLDETSTDTTGEIGDVAAIDSADPVSLYMKQKMDEEITEAFNQFSTDYPQVRDSGEYDKFTREVTVLSQTILNSQGRLAAPDELYSKAAIVLGWDKQTAVTSQDKLGQAVKDSASSSRTSSATKPNARIKSKVTDEMVKVNRRMYPGKSDQEIRKELEEYVI